MLEFSVLASGSSGNSLYLQTESTKILLDAGISGKQIRTRLETVGASPLDEIDAILLTHEHIDHVRGLSQVIKHSTAPVYATEGTWSGSGTKVNPESFDINRWHRVQDKDTLTIGDITVTTFAVSHDAEEPVAFRFDSNGESLAVVTDLGYMSDTIKSVLTGCHTYILETNHDVDMLRAGRYPWSVKRRILSDKGHLSNHDATLALADLLGTDEVSVYLAHLSEENNQRDLAELTVESLLHEIKPHYKDQTRLHHTSRHEPTPLCRAVSPFVPRSQ
ncbi:MBL fold metallo-hydrolase [Alicyclobacillus sp. SO9]|uniref:MBL fold metallo-hydrolase n=1 Tax=Alicyclobacillus sp. SO9 TaxID=2665646 RepID=UPI0018E76119|nr:MBL fold metallo-hydrolase [Alicyclobacillus sp. SO9]QQE78928.1 MBL fold metallo-hydrolase [Alicyclobacillus sp. SO9]